MKTPLYPAPWNLNGDGYIFVYHFSKVTARGKFFNPGFIENTSAKGFGTIMLVDYHSSTAGPYYELLFTPGKFYYKGKWRNSITKIYVSTAESVINGRKNWGIPKERADFKFIDIGENRQRIIVEKDGQMIIDISIKRGNFSFPISTKIMPMPLAQKINDTVFFY